MSGLVHLISVIERTLKLSVGNVLVVCIRLNWIASHAYGIHNGGEAPD